VLVHAPGLTVERWSDLTDASLAPVAIPDPGFAGSALGALGFFALDEDFGFGFYRALADQGAVEVRSPGDVVTGVAEGRFTAGMTLDFSARNAVDKGSPIEILWPEPGAVAIFSPIAVVDGRPALEAAKSLVDFVLGTEAQELIAGTGWQPIRRDVTWEAGGEAVTPDWDAIYNRQDELLNEYRSVFGG
jgi:iron(III) transport system substrate-binding protein